MLLRVESMKNNSPHHFLSSPEVSCEAGLVRVCLERRLLNVTGHVREAWRKSGAWDVAEQTSFSVFTDLIQQLYFKF